MQYHLYDWIGGRNHGSQLHIDPLHFGQIWQNLIENAVKYMGNQPQPQIEMGVTQQAHDVVFYVRDNGMGSRLNIVIGYSIFSPN